MLRRDISEYVISSRIRLARNFADYPFPNKLSASGASVIIQKVTDSLANLKGYTVRRVSALGTLESESLKEKHLISKELAKNGSGGIALREDGCVSIMINEEDHLREQCILSGMDLERAFSEINEVDDLICSDNKIAYDEKLGFLTACPTNLGTGMRASVMMFLPAITLGGNLGAAMTQLMRFGITMRGVYGEGSEAEGYRYQISNNNTLGFSEADFLTSVISAAYWLAELEEKAREELYNINDAEFIDKIYRAYGLLTSSYKMSSGEFMRLISQIKLGCYLDIIRLRSMDELEKLISDAQPATLTIIHGKPLSAEARDIFRSKYVAQVLKDLRV